MTSGLNLGKHMSISHAPPEKRPFQCETCGASFIANSHLNTHKQSHLPKSERKLSKCPHCAKSFTLRSYMESHVRTVHLKEESCVCEVCGKTFGNFRFLQSHHTRIHTDRPTQECPKCGTQVIGIREHMARCQAERVPCTHCGKVIAKHYLRHHICPKTKIKRTSVDA